MPRVKEFRSNLAFRKTETMIWINFSMEVFVPTFSLFGGCVRENKFLISITIFVIYAVRYKWIKKYRIRY